MRVLVYDVANILYRVAAVQKHKSPFAKDAEPEDLVGLCMHISLQSIYKWYTKYRPDFVVFAFEGGSNWRKQYTEMHQIRRQYKANRVQDPEMVHFYQLVDAFRHTMTHHTSICCLTVESMEGDDVIAAYAQLNANTDNEVYIVSGDRDFVQLLKLPNIKLVDPDSGKLRNQPGDKEYQADLDYFIFLKCIRGDTGDNVPSAYPKVRETRIKEAYEDQYKRLNFLNERWTDENGKEHRVGDLFAHNEVLMHLEKQPDELRAYLLEEVDKQVKELGHYSHFHFLKFLGQFKLKRVGEEAHKFVELFTNNQRYLKGEKLSEEPQSEQKQNALEQLRDQSRKASTKTNLLDI